MFTWCFSFILGLNFIFFCSWVWYMSCSSVENKLTNKHFMRGIVNSGCFPFVQQISQTIPVTIMSLSIKIFHLDQSNHKIIVCMRELVFQQKPLEKAYFHSQTDWSGHGLAGQFWQMESALTFSLVWSVKALVWSNWTLLFLHSAVS